MMHYERVRADLAQAKRTLKTALGSEMDSETERAALEDVERQIEGDASSRLFFHPLEK